MDLPNIGTVGGEWDLRQSVNDYLGRFPFQGKRVLDVGTASGFLTFEIEKQGGAVVSFDIDDGRRYGLVPFHRFREHREHTVAGIAQGMNRQKNAYWLAHRALGSKAQAYYGDVYRLPTELGRFDVVVLGQVLVHLRDPFAALAAAGELSDDAIIVIEAVLDDRRPIALLHPNTDTGGPPHSWWRWSAELYRHAFGILGFQLDSVRKKKHLCVASGKPEWVELATLVGRRHRAL